MSATGHFHIKNALKKSGAPLAGEMSGHIFFNDECYGFDDGHYSAFRLIEIIAQMNENLSSIFGNLPKAFSTPEINIEVETKTASEPEIEIQTEEETPVINGKAIVLGLNDKIAFEKNLFADNGDDLQRVLSQLNTFTNWDDAKSFVLDFVKPDYNNWENKEEFEVRFLEIVENKFK